MTANTVMASANRAIPVRHFWRSRYRMALIRVPAWPIPIQNTKFVIAQPQPTGLLLPHVPMPRNTVSATAQAPIKARMPAKPIAAHHRWVGKDSIGV